MPNAYIIADVQVLDPVQYEQYRALSTKAMQEHNAKVLVRGGTTEHLEGRQPGRTVVLEFPDMASAKAFYESQTYTQARQAREEVAVMNMFIVQGV